MHMEAHPPSPPCLLCSRVRQQALSAAAAKAGELPPWGSAHIRFAAPLPASHSLSVLRDRTFKLPWKQMLATRNNRRAGGEPGGRARGVEVSLAGFPWPVAHLCHTPEGNTDERVQCPSALSTERRISSFRRGHGRSSSWVQRVQTRGGNVR